jgi:predicted ATPase
MVEGRLKPMATDLETKTEAGEPALARPSLKIIGLHIRGLKSIDSLDLPADGLGWDGAIPNIVMVGGINGSGKTTLLEFLAGAFAQINISTPDGQYVELPQNLIASEARIDFSFGHTGDDNPCIRFLFGNADYIHENYLENWFGFQYFGKESSIQATFVGARTSKLFTFFHYVQSKNYYLKIPSGMVNLFSDHNTGPALVYFPSEGRNLVIPETSYKMPGNLTPPEGFVQRWQRPQEWKDSLPARLYALRWEDLNAKEEGRPEDATHFQSYHLAFDRFFEGRKRLRWTPKGELVVETKSGDIHDLSELSSGEKQVILFMGELLHRWRPGSLILIDEPELHLHEYYQTKLWHSLVDWQKERGGQVILATQSAHLFGLSGLGTRLILSGWPR